MERIRTKKQMRARAQYLTSFKRIKILMIIMMAIAFVFLVKIAVLDDEKPTMEVIFIAVGNFWTPFVCFAIIEYVNAGFNLLNSNYNSLSNDDDD